MATRAHMKVLSDIVVCTRCDALYRRPTLANDQIARCVACDAVVWRSTRRSIEAWLALTLASAIMLTLANTFPVIRAGVQNFQNDVTLWAAMTSLAQGAWAPLAAPATVFAIIAPCLQIVLLGWVLAFAWLGKRPPCFRQFMKLLMIIHPWSMIEVAFLGVIVACIKLSSMADVSLGAGAWAMLGSIVLTAATTKRDVRWLWSVTDTRWISHAKRTT